MHSFHTWSFGINNNHLCSDPDMHRQTAPYYQFFLNLELHASFIGVFKGYACNHVSVQTIIYTNYIIAV